MPQVLSTDPNWGQAATPEVLSSDPNWGAEPPATPSAPSRFVHAAAEWLNPVPAIKAVVGAVSHPIDTVTGIPAQLAAMNAAKQAEESRLSGVPMAEIGARAKADFATSDPATLAGAATGFILPAALLKGAQMGMQARTATKVARMPAEAHADALMAIPPTRSAPYSPEDWQAAKPYLNAEHAASPITSVEGFRNAADTAIEGIERKVGEYVAAFPTARRQVDVTSAIKEAFEGHPDSEALTKALKELESLHLDAEKTLPEMEDARRYLNAKNKAVLKQNNYDVATARQVDPAFAAREIAAAKYRDGIYTYLEDRGVEGVRDLRRDEGSVIKLRNAAQRQIFSGEKGVVGSAEPSLARSVAAEVVKHGLTVGGAGTGSIFGPVGTAVGAVSGAAGGEKAARAIRGAKLTRDELLARAFARPDARVPSFPVVPEQPPIAGLLEAPAIPLGAVPDSSFVRGVPAETAGFVRKQLPPASEPLVTPPPADPSGPRPVTAADLPEHYVREMEDQARWRQFVTPQPPADVRVPPAPTPAIEAPPRVVVPEPVAVASAPRPVVAVTAPAPVVSTPKPARIAKAAKEPATATVQPATVKAEPPAKAAEKVAAQIERVVDLSGAKSGAQVQAKIVETLRNELADAKKASGIESIEYQEPTYKNGQARVTVNGEHAATIDKYGEVTFGDEGPAATYLNPKDAPKSSPKPPKTSLNTYGLKFTDMTAKERERIAKAVVASHYSSLSNAGKLSVHIPGDGIFTIDRNPYAIEHLMQKIMMTSMKVSGELGKSSNAASAWANLVKK